MGCNISRYKNQLISDYKMQPMIYNNIRAKIYCILPKTPWLSVIEAFLIQFKFYKHCLRVHSLCIVYFI